MTHEIKRLFDAYRDRVGDAAVLVTIVHLEGSSYRRPGARMLFFQDGTSVGAVSGGCVEKAVQVYARSVFDSGIPAHMEYDGRIRLGCEGVLHLLIEPFAPDANTIDTVLDWCTGRESLSLETYWSRDNEEPAHWGSMLSVAGRSVFFRPITSLSGPERYAQVSPPLFRLVIVGTEHDAVRLSATAASMGWEVILVADPRDGKDPVHFPGTTHFIEQGPGPLEWTVDDRTAVVLMTHSYAKDLAFFIGLADRNSAYLGILGPVKRREKLFDDALERGLLPREGFLDSVHGPAGLDIGAETAEEIAVSIVADILAVTRGREGRPLRLRTGHIHS